jgi:hypothetical protein
VYFFELVILSSFLDLEANIVELQYLQLPYISR